jgi:caffeoyl-CoA O-methyltransferase
MRKNYDNNKIELYCHAKTSEHPELLKNLELETKHETDCPQMLCGKLEGRFLKLLTQLVKAQHILEIGMFTGYSALSMAEGLPNNGKLITLDINPETEKMARKYFSKSPHGHKIEIMMGPALDTINKLKNKIDYNFDLVFIDAEKRQYPDYFLNVLPMVRVGGLLIIDNTLSDGRVLAPITTERGKLMDEFNQLVLEHPGVESVLLPVRDGITLIRKN